MPRSLDRFELMRLLVRIAETGSLSAAGRSLGLSQPSVSRQLRALETELGAQLIMRTTHELSFTEAGEEFHLKARGMLADWEAALEQASAGNDELQGAIRIAAPIGLGQSVLVDLASGFLKEHPGVSIEWRVVDEPKDLIADGLDLWIRIGSVRDESLIVRAIWTIERVIVSAASERLEARHPQQLESQPAVILGPYVGSEIELRDPGGATFTLKPSARFTTDNIFAAERMTKSGAGYSILPLWLVEGAINAGELETLCGGWHPPPLQLALAYPQTRFRPARVRAFIDHLRGQLEIFANGIVSA